MARSNKKYKVAIIGAGWAGVGSELDLLRIKPASHAEAAAVNKRVKLAAFVDTDPRALKLTSRLYPKVPQFPEAQAMFDEVKPDIVIIATNPDTHSRYIELASRNRVKAILCEKPISHDLSDARRAVAAAKKNKALLFINHQRRFDPLVRRFRNYVRNEYVRDTFFGKPKAAIAYYNRGLYHAGTHFIDLLRFFLGEVKWVSAVRREGAAKGDFAADCFLGFATGAVAILQYYDSGNFLHSDVSFFGQGGRLDLKKQAGLEIETTGIRSSPDYSGYRELDYEHSKTFGAPRSWFKPIIPHIIDCLEGRDKPVSTGTDALRALEIIEALIKSARSGGRKVNL